MVAFTEACEIASCHFGAHTRTSCIACAWACGDEWRFVPAGATCDLLGVRECIAVNSANGTVRSAWPPKFAEDISEQIPWQYQPRRRTVPQECGIGAGISDKTNVSESKAPSLGKWTRIA